MSTTVITAPKKGLPVLEDVRVASPCHAEWNDMVGSESVRFCASCQKNVYNLSGMKRDEAEELLRATEGNVCVRFYRRADGTVLTEDCPVGIRLAVRRAKKVTLAAAAVSAAAIGTIVALLGGAALVKRTLAPEPVMGEVAALPVDEPVPPPVPAPAPVLKQGGASLPPPELGTAIFEAPPTPRPPPPKHTMGKPMMPKRPPPEQAP